jgi:CHASE2 domain-containing sensor protein
MGIPDWRKLLDWRGWRTRLNLWAALSPVERKLFIRIFLGGMLLTAGVLVADAIGMLSNLENWLYDQRAKSCQLFTPPPSDQIVHLDIDDGSIEAIGHWPWPRIQMARLMEEVVRASPRALAIDVLYSEREMVQRPDGKTERSPGDPAFAAALAKVNGVVIPVSLLIAIVAGCWTVERIFY